MVNFDTNELGSTCCVLAAIAAVLAGAFSIAGFHDSSVIALIIFAVLIVANFVLMIFEIWTE